MTLRDYFAAQAMSAILSEASMVCHLKELAKESSATATDSLAMIAYDFADGMLRVRRGVKLKT